MDQSDASPRHGPFFWFGAEPGLPLPAIEAYASPRRPTHNKEGERPLRKNHRLIPGREFQRLETLDQVLTALLGPLPGEIVAA